MGEITSELGDGIHGTPEYDPNGDYFFVNGNNLCNGKIIIKEDTKRVSITEFNKYKKNLNEKTVFVSINGTLGNVAFYNNESIILGKSACYLNLFKQKLKLYIFALLNSEYFKKYSYENATGSTIKNVSLKSMRDFLLPLPPLSEQQLIVAEIEKIFAQIDLLEQNKTDLQTAIKQAKSKILDLAIHGKLVSQDPNDEPAEDLLKRISTSDNRPYGKVEEEFDYEIPKNWRFCKVKDVCSVIMGQSPEGESVSDDKNGMEFHQGKICFGKKYLEESSSFTKHITKIAPKDSVLLCVRAPVGIVNITEREICIGRGLCAVIPKYEINSDFWFYWLQSLQSDFEQKATGTTFRAISVDVIKNQIVAIPPHGEQNRIMNKINELYEQLDKIVLNLV